MNSTGVASTPKRRKQKWEIPFGFEKEILAYERKKGLDVLTSLYTDAFEIGQPKGLEAGRDEGVMAGWLDGLDPGREQGLRKGIRQGTRDGQISLILRVLKRRWGTIAPQLEARLSKLSLTQLEKWGDTILELPDPSALQQWLRNNRKRL